MNEINLWHLVFCLVGERQDYHRDIASEIFRKKDRLLGQFDNSCFPSSRHLLCQEFPWPDPEVLLDGANDP